MSEIDFFNLSFPDKFECKVGDLKLLDTKKGIVTTGKEKFVVRKVDFDLISNLIKREDEHHYTISLSGRRYYEI